MLDAFPIYHWFHNGNPYSGAEQGMRYVITPGKKADPADESGKRKIEFLTVTVPGRGALSTPPRKRYDPLSLRAARRGWMLPWPGCMSATRVICPAGRTFRPFWTASRIADGPAQ